MQDAPLISVIIPVYNVERYLTNCLNSLASQTMQDIEVICVDDGSSDRSGEILDEYAQADPRFKVIHQKNKGASSARNTGLDAARGKIACFVDSDDWVEPEMCERVAATFEDNPGADIVVFGTNVMCDGHYDDPWMDSAVTTPDKVYDAFEPKLLFNEPVLPFIWHEALSMDLLNSNGLRFDEDLAIGEDQLFQFVVFPRAEKVVLISDKIYDYRYFREGSLMDINHADPLVKLRQHVRIAERICERWTDSGDIERYGSWLMKWIIDFFGWDVLSLAPEIQFEMCPQVAGLFERFFPEGFEDVAGLSKYERERFDWICSDLSREEREKIQKHGIHRNSRRLFLERQGVGSAAGELAHRIAGKIRRLLRR